MTPVYEKKTRVSISRTDYTGRLGVADACSLFMDTAAEHFEELGLGVAYLIGKQRFWLTVRTRVRLLIPLGAMEKITVSTWPERPQGKRQVRDYRILAENGRVAAVGKTQWALLDLATGRPAEMEDIHPADFPYMEECVIDEDFAWIDDDFSNDEVLGTYTVRSCDIDLGGHMNNVTYIRVLLGLFSTKQLREMDVRDLEVVFRSSCLEGEAITWKQRRNKSNLEIAAFRPNGQAAFFALIRREEEK